MAMVNSVRRGVLNGEGVVEKEMVKMELGADGEIKGTDNGGKKMRPKFVQLKRSLLS